MTISTFADRLWWARHRAGLGATRLARMAGCSQSLISSLERNDAEKSRLSNQFADALKVDRTWLAFGVDDRAPQGFDPVEARTGREAMSGATPDGATAVGEARMRNMAAEPRWVTEPPVAGPDVLMKNLITSFTDFARIAGSDRATMLLDMLTQAAKSVAYEEKMKAVDKYAPT